MSSGEHIVVPHASQSPADEHQQSLTLGRAVLVSLCVLPSVVLLVVGAYAKW